MSRKSLVIKTFDGTQFRAQVPPSFTLRKLANFTRKKARTANLHKTTPKGDVYLPGEEYKFGFYSPRSPKRSFNVNVEKRTLGELFPTQSIFLDVIDVPRPRQRSPRGASGRGTGARAPIASSASASASSAASAASAAQARRDLTQPTQQPQQQSSFGFDASASAAAAAARARAPAAAARPTQSLSRPPPGGKQPLAVIAFGGNALLRDGQKGTIEDQLQNCYDTCKHLVPLIRSGMDIVLTHGNGPQVGVNLLKNEAGLEKYELPKFPMFVCGAETQGMIGYCIESQMRAVLAENGIQKNVITIVTQVEVDPADEAFSNPRKFVGPYYSKDEADALAAENGWAFKEFSGGGRWRRVVPSPKPIHVNNAEVIESLARAGNIIICVGGGGIPVKKDPVTGHQVGINAVIDKDLASSFLATQIRADQFIIFTCIPNVFINFGTPQQKCLFEVSVMDAKRYMAQGHFGEGSMKPKIAAAVGFVENSTVPNAKTIITDAAAMARGARGTTIIPFIDPFT